LGTYLCCPNTYAEAAEKIHELEAKLKAFEDWDAQKTKYELVELEPGIRVYRTKESEVKMTHWSRCASVASVIGTSGYCNVRRGIPTDVTCWFATTVGPSSM
jgi:hypothetical protein